MSLDFLITDAEVYDGLGGEPRKLSVGISGDRIVYVGQTPSACSPSKIIDGRGLWLSPGFIDSHASTGLGYLRKGAADNKLFQGVTCELIGNCGTSTGPVGEHLVDVMHEQGEKIGFSLGWRSLGEYYDLVEAFGLPINLGSLVGHSTLRMGELCDWQSVSEAELKAMCAAMAQAMEQGAFGLSSGLIYPPGCFADTAELIELAKMAGHHGGFYASHIRDERNNVAEAVQEALEIGRGAGVPVLVSHLKAADKQNWGKIPGILARIEAFRAQHDMKVIVDVYPYTAVSTKLRAFLPKEILADGITAVSAKLATEGWRSRAIDWLIQRETDLDQMIVISEDIPGTAGLSVAKIAADWKLTPQQTACELVRREPETWMVYHCISEADMDAAVMWRDSIICSDSWSYPINARTTIGNPHPRTYGAFSRYLNRYVFQTGKLSYGDAIHKITAAPANFLGLSDRGRIAEGCVADVLLMDPNRFADKATYQAPRSIAEGVSHLLINGRQAIARGELIDDKCGKVVRPRRG